ncbi:hypothetical protein CMUS01_04026 [Colletotrichum musicola]|uniref:Uncharacterized protein n=1 Tax=Colletotrichum musicola TaxID=2175873 RepID=A0A8H6NPK1_9PEZI|nr:hypothetical protein CMUS01_04026 [Colletotrichum musicola]
MTRKGRSSTLCEWALGVSVEEYCDSVQRRRARKSSGRQRISVEISTDDESEEDTVKITYPRAGRTKESSTLTSNIKKVRFQNAMPKSALKATDTADADSAEVPAQCCVWRLWQLTDTVTGDKSKSGEAETSESEADPKPKKSEKKTHRSEKSSKKKVIDSSSESEAETEATETETDSEDETPPVPKNKKQNKNKESKKVEKKVKDKVTSEIEPNNVGPTTKKRVEKNDAIAEKTKKRKETEKLRPEAALSPHLRRPNLIMPVRAEVLQVEHTIEGVEDPRPNAFVDHQHGVVRVYHGPAYGNPYGLLYPARDPSRRPLSIGVPHPLQNPYFHGFANPSNPGDNHFKGHSPWGGIPVTCMPGGPPLMAPIDPTQMPAYWGPMSPTRAVSVKGSPKPVMSGANPAAKEQGWDTNVGPGAKVTSPPKENKSKPPDNVAPVSPLKINLTVNPNTPWAELATSLGKKSSPGKDGSQAGSKVNGWGSNNGSKRSWGSKKSTGWQTLPGGQHPDLAWGAPEKSQTGSNSGWGQNNNDNFNWTQTGDANNDAWGATGNNDGWNTTTADGPSDGAWAASGNTQGNNGQGSSGGDNNWGASNDQSGDAWNNVGGNYADVNWGTGSNHSNKSKKSNNSRAGGGNSRNASGQSKSAPNWDGQSNNVGFSGRVVSSGSNGSHHSQKSQPQASSNGGWDNNAGPTTNSPVGQGSNKSSGSKRDGSQKGSNNVDAWKTGDIRDNSTWISDNNAGPTTNSPNASQTSKNSKKSDKNNDDAYGAGNGAGWGPETTGGEFNYNPTGTEMSKGSSSSKSMPGAWEPTWGDPSLAQSTGGAADVW